MAKEIQRKNKKNCNNDRTKAFWKVFVLCCILLLLFFSAVLLDKEPNIIVMKTPSKQSVKLEIPRGQAEIYPYQISVTQSGRIVLKEREQIGEEVSATLPSSVAEGSLESMLRKRQADAVGEAVDNADRKWEEITEKLTYNDEFAFTSQKEKDGYLYQFANQNADMYYCSVTDIQTGRGLFISSLSPEKLDFFNAYIHIR